MSYQQPPQGPWQSQQQPQSPWQGQQPSQPLQPNTGYQQPSEPPWPQPLPPQYYPQSKQKRTVRIGMWIGIGLVAVLIGVGIINVAVSSTASQMVKVGQTITLHGVAATLTGVGALECGGNTCQPEQIAAHIRLVNNSGSEQPYSFLHFHAKSGAGVITSAVLTLQALYQSGTLLVLQW